MCATTRDDRTTDRDRHRTDRTTTLANVRVRRRRQRRPFYTRVFWTFMQQCFFAMKSGVLINDVPWSGRYFVMHSTKRVKRSTWNPLPLEFQASICAFKDLTTSSMSNSLPLLTSCGRVMKWAGKRCAPFSTSRYIVTVAWMWTRIDLYTFTKHHLNVL